MVEGTPLDDNRELRFPCRCCGHLVFHEPPGSYDICPVCFWEDDIVQLRWPDYAGGANHPSLIDAQQDTLRLGAKQARVAGYVRPRAADELMEPGWRPVDPETDSFDSPDARELDWPLDSTVLYYWRDTFWRRDRRG